MFTNNLIYISETDTRDDYISLNLRLDSGFYEWEEAIGIMQRRIQGRYLDPMRALIDTDPNKNGFAAMALCCLLIETLMQFREGFPETPVGKNKGHYTNFLRNQLGDVFNQKMADRFYNDIRCGILHSAQTKNDTCLTFNTDYTVMLPRNGVLMVNFERMYHKIYTYFIRYCEELKDSNNIELRKNFIHKMDDISNKNAGMEIINTIWVAICEKEQREIKLSKAGSFRFEANRNSLHICNTKGLRGVGNRVYITKNEIKQALNYWPDEIAIKMLNNGNFIYSILNICIC